MGSKLDAICSLICHDLTCTRMSSVTSPQPNTGQLLPSGIGPSLIGKAAVTDLTFHPSILFIHVIHDHHILSIEHVEKS